MALIKINDFSATSVTNFDLDNIFTTDYDVYDIKINSIDMVNTTNAQIKMQFIDTSGSIVNTSTYYRTSFIFNTTNDTWNYSSNQSGTEFNWWLGGAADDTEGMQNITIFEPQNANVYTTGMFNANGWHTSGFVYVQKGGLREDTQQAVRGIRLFSEMDFNSVSATVWGYSKA